ncbi:hypothetical protein [Streptomyces triticiradicis]|uniref:DUF3426 domain-containing protein n=1 Tax=Streptomyces triticiradicis TaxID=2651189 RepID=A0A7J5D758_9ACTN|nr:hypothetical protein [Streptomyces triticiradicis]KAB1978968.1 hypothetical protein F8144_37635 [Streptomyces triticiradicis]
MSRRVPHGRSGSRRVAVLLSAIACGSVLVSCSSDDGGGSGATASITPRPTPPNTSNFTGTPPSAIASAASSIIASASERASSAAASVEARASEFAASVSADTARAAATAEKQLKNVQGSGNATSEVAMTGVPLAETGGVRAVLITITNKSGETASYAVQVDFKNPDGKVVETKFVGKEDLEPGKKATPIVISRQPAEPQLTAVLTKAQRY